MIERRGKSISDIYMSRNFKTNPKFVEKVASALEDDQNTNKVYENIEDRNILHEVNLVQILVERTGLTEDEVLRCLAELVNKTKVAYSKTDKTYYKDSSIIN